jgi:hypothetical protein
MVWIPTFVYAMDVYGKNKREAIDNFKQWARIDRMPNNYAIWEK